MPPSAAAALATLASSMAQFAGVGALLDGSADELLRAHLALLPQPPEHLLSSLPATLQAAASCAADDGVALLVLVRTVLLLVEGGSNERREHALRHVLLPLLRPASDADILPAPVVEMACEGIVTIVAGDVGLIAELRTTAFSSLDAAAAADGDETAGSRHGSGTITMSATAAACLGMHLQRVAPDVHASFTLAIAAARLALSTRHDLRATSLRLLSSAELDLDASSDEVWAWLARGCAVDTPSVRLHCFTTAAALHERLRGAWRRASLGQAPLPAPPSASPPPTASTPSVAASSAAASAHPSGAPQALLLGALRRDGALRSSSPEAKAAAFMVREAIGEGAEAAAWDEYFQLHGALEAYDVYLIQPAWPAGAAWWLGGDGLDGHTYAGGGHRALPPPPAWPWIEVLLVKAFAHPNITVRYWAASQLLEHIARRGGNDAIAEAAGGATADAAGDATADASADCVGVCNVTDSSSNPSPPVASPPVASPPMGFMISQLLPLLLQSSAAWRADSGTGDDHGHVHVSPAEATVASAPPTTSVAASALAAAVRRAWPRYVSQLVAREGVGVAADWTEAVLRACLAAPKQLACEHLLGALAPARSAVGALGEGGFCALRDLLYQAARSHGRVAQSRLWRAGVRALLSLAEPTALGLLPLVELLRSAPAAESLLPSRPPSLAPSPGGPSSSTSPLGEAVVRWLSSPTLADDKWSWLEAQASEAVRGYLEKCTRSAGSPAGPGASGTRAGASFVPTASDLDDSAHEAATVCAACALLRSTSQAIERVLAPLCTQLVSVHARPYLHPLHAPRRLLLLRALIESGALQAADAAARKRIVSHVVSCAEGCCGVVELALSAARNFRVADAGSTDEEQIEWLCARAVACVSAAAVCAAALPEVISLTELVSGPLLGGLSAGLAAPPAARPHGERLRLMAAQALGGTARALAAYGVATPRLWRPVASALAALLGACASDAAAEADGTPNLEARLGSAGETRGDERLAYRVEVARWEALAALMDASDASNAEASIASRAAAGAPLPLPPALPTCLPPAMVAALSRCAGDDDALHAILRCAGRLMATWLAVGSADGGAAHEIGDTIEAVRCLHASMLDGLRLLRGTALRPALCTSAADTLLGLPAVGCPSLQAECFAAYDYLIGLGRARPFAAQLGASRLCLAAAALPGQMLPWGSRLHALLLYGEQPPRAGTAICTSLDDDLPCRLSTTAAAPAERTSTAAKVVDGCTAALDEGVDALQEALSAGGDDAQHRAATHRVRALGLRLLHELLPIGAELEERGQAGTEAPPLSASEAGGGGERRGHSEAAAALLSAVASLLLSSVAAPDAEFPKWQLPQTLGARRCLRSWQALSLLGPQLRRLSEAVRAAATCIWRLLAQKPLPRVRQYMETFAVSLVLSDAPSAAATLSAALGDATLSRDAAASAIMVSGAALASLPAAQHAEALAATLPHLVAWATAPYHTPRLLAVLVLQGLHRTSAAAAAAAADDDDEGAARAPDGTSVGRSTEDATARLLDMLASFFAAQPQMAAAAAATAPALRLPLLTERSAASLYDARGTAIAAGAGMGESAALSAQVCSLPGRP